MHSTDELLISVQVDKLEVVNKKWVRVQLLPGAPDSTVNERINGRIP